MEGNIFLKKTGEIKHFGQISMYNNVHKISLLGMTIM